MELASLRLCHSDVFLYTFDATVFLSLLTFYMVSYKSFHCVVFLLFCIVCNHQHIIFLDACVSFYELNNKEIVIRLCYEFSMHSNDAITFSF